MFYPGAFCTCLAGRLLTVFASLPRVDKCLCCLQVGAGAGKAPSLMNIQMELRKCCNHPFMVRGVEDHEVDQIVGTLMEAAQKEVRMN